MPGKLIGRVLPAHQRRTLDELTNDLDLTAGDSSSKKSAFWTMLVLSAVIAAAGVLADSTATVIGAMIIAPLSTPIMGVALGVVLRDGRMTRRAAGFTVTGAASVVSVGVVFTFLVPGSEDLLANSQITGRVTPGLVDLIAAVATGFAGAIALSRRDVAAVLPGVAIAISLVPPLVVVGVCLSQGAIALAFGALVLFASNFVALVLAGTLVYAAAGYAAESHAAEELSRRKSVLAISLLLVVVLIPLLGNSVAVYAVSVWTGRVETAAEQWVSEVPGASVQKVEIASNAVYVHVQTPRDLPPTDRLVADLQGRIPNGIPVVVTTSLGEQIEAGTVGG